jgi:hypothetical protein
MSVTDLRQTSTFHELSYLHHHPHTKPHAGGMDHEDEDEDESATGGRLSRDSLLSFLDTLKQSQSPMTPAATSSSGSCWCCECLLVLLLLRVLSCEAVAVSQLHVSDANASSSNSTKSAGIPLAVVNRWERCDITSLIVASSEQDHETESSVARKKRADRCGDGLGVFVSLALPNGSNSSIECCIHLSCSTDSSSYHECDGTTSVAIATSSRSMSAAHDDDGDTESVMSQRLSSDEPATKRQRTVCNREAQKPYAEAEVGISLSVRLVAISASGDNAQMECDSEVRYVFACRQYDSSVNLRTTHNTGKYSSYFLSCYRHILLELIEGACKTIQMCIINIHTRTCTQMETGT